MDGEINSGMPGDAILAFIESEDFWALVAANPALAPFAARPIVEEYLTLGGLDRLGPNARPATPRPAKSRTPLSQDERRKSARRIKPNDLRLTSVQRAFAQAQRQVRNRRHAWWVKRLYDDRCAICGNTLTVDALGTGYSEAGHVRPVGEPFNGPDHFRNILPFCPNHHKAFDRGGVWIDPNEGSPIVRSATTEQTFDRRRLELDVEHEFDLEFAEWHARYFGHL